MKAWIRHYLGHDQLIDHLMDLDMLIKDIHVEIQFLRSDIAAHNQALARIIAKLDPMLGMAEDNPDRVRASKEIEDRVIKELKAQQEVIDHYGHRPKRSGV